MTKARDAARAVGLLLAFGPFPAHGLAEFTGGDVGPGSAGIFLDHALEILMRICESSFPVRSQRR